VVAAGALAEAARWLRAGTGAAAVDVAERPVGRPLRHLRIALAAFVALYALQAVYSTDLEVALKNVCLFYAPFAVMLRLLDDVDWSAARLRHAFWLIVGLALLFAVVGFYEYASGHLLLSNAKVQEANDLKPYFRVNSLFFDPNIYGRFLALTMIALAATLVWTRSRSTVLLSTAALGVLWAGLVLSLSQSSFAALLGGLAVIGVLRWKPLPVLGAIAVLAAVAIAVVALSPGSLEIDTRSTQSLDKATSGRFDLVRGALTMARDRPVWGFGSGAFAERYRAREGVRSVRVAAVSHTIPLTVVAEQGAIGLLAYLVLMIVAFRLVFGGVRARVRRWPPGITSVAAAAVAAAFFALMLHTFVYAAFLEDPLSWALLAVAGALASRAPAASRSSRAAVTV
jgi:O-antigen ligase